MPSRSALAIRASEFPFVRPVRLPLRRQFFDQQKSGVVPRLRVFRARISQTHDEKNMFHARGKRLCRRKNYFFFSALASGLASAFLSPAAAAFASPLAGAFSPALPAGGTFGAFFLLFLGHLDIAGGRSGFGGDHFFLGARRGHGHNGDVLVAQNFHARRRNNVAEVDGLADFQRGHVQR